jgi:hypothetical protein
MAEKAPALSPLDIIERLESKGKNVENFRYDEGHTAQGYWQITNSTWRDTAPKAGIDLKKYPTAMSAPREVQKVAAQTLFDQYGYAPWAPFNPALAKAVGWTGPMHQEGAGGAGQAAGRRMPGRFGGMGPLVPGGDDAPAPAAASGLRRAMTTPEAPGVPIEVAPAAASGGVAQPAAAAAPLQPIAPIQGPNLQGTYRDALAAILSGRRRPLGSMFG